MNTQIKDAGLVNIATANKLNLAEVRLLLIILGLSAEDGICEVTLDWLCGALGAQRANVSRCLSRLTNLGIIKRLDEGNRGRGAKPYTIQYNPDPDTYAYNLEEATPQLQTQSPNQTAADLTSAHSIAAPAAVPQDATAPAGDLEQKVSNLENTIGQLQAIIDKRDKDRATAEATIQSQQRHIDDLTSQVDQLQQPTLKRVGSAIMAFFKHLFTDD